MMTNAQAAGHAKQFVQHFMLILNTALLILKGLESAYTLIEKTIYMCLSLQVHIPRLNVTVEKRIKLKEKSTASVPFARLPVHPETFLKSQIPVFPLNVICVEIRRHQMDLNVSSGV